MILFTILQKNANISVHHQQLMDFLSDEDLVSKFQFGYRPQRSTSQAAILLTDDIRREVDKGNLVGTVFIDPSKAFDSLSHAVLLTKLEAYGIKGIIRDREETFCHRTKFGVEVQRTHYKQCGFL